jgi:hypothetical protein
MSYDFASLSPADFEDLVRDLVGRELGVVSKRSPQALMAASTGAMEWAPARSSYKQNIMPAQLMAR